ncbi:hypothetical protein C8R42DRAFT_781348 [Lentinula raphanica]|nr:hypothetical protein C8R42DRAFT_781348 [Lentinula raphanica]
MPRVRDDPPPPPYEAPAAAAVPAAAAPAPVPDVIDDKKPKHDIECSITDLIRKTWTDDYEAALNISLAEGAAWRSKKSEEILGLLERKEGLFAGSKGARGDCRKANLDALKQCFRNMGSGILLRKQAKQAAKQVAGPQVMSKEAAQAVVDAVCKLTGPLAGRDLYERAHKNEIKASAKDGDTGNAAGNYQRALKQRWLEIGQEERRVWERRALDQAQDVDGNQELLLSIVNHMFMSMAKCGRFGEMEFVTLLAMRSTNGTLHARAVSGGTSGQEFQETLEDWGGHYLDPFRDWADGVLPRVQEDVSLIRRDEAGYPVFPVHIQTLETPAKDLQRFVKTYFNLLYRAQYDEELPWEELYEKPEDFYDVIKYNLPVALKDPVAMEFSIFPLVAFLKELELPFRFRRYVTPPERLGEAVITRDDSVLPTGPPAAHMGLPPTVVPNAPPALAPPAVNTTSTPPALISHTPPMPFAIMATPAPPAPEIIPNTPSVASAISATSPAIIPNTIHAPPAVVPIAPPAPSVLDAVPVHVPPAVVPSATPVPFALTTTPAPASSVSACPTPLSSSSSSSSPLASTSAAETLAGPAVTPAVALSPPAPEIPSRRGRSAKNRNRGKKRKQVEVNPSTAAVHPTALQTITTTTASSDVPMFSAHPASLGASGSAPQFSPRKTRAVRNKESSSLELTGNGKKRKQGEREDSSIEVELPGRKKSKFWTYRAEFVPGADADNANSSR